jgi:hypothetical protein
MIVGYLVLVTDSHTGHVERVRFETPYKDDAERFAAAMAAARGDGTDVKLKPITAPDMPDGLRPLTEAEAA